MPDIRLTPPSRLRGTGSIRAASERLIRELQARVEELSALLSPPDWISPTLNLGWSDLGSGNAVSGYRKLADGTVELKGLITGGTAGVIFTLPVGYRPQADVNFVCYSQNGVNRVEVQSDGDVDVSFLDGGTFMALDPVKFNVDAD